MMFNCRQNKDTGHHRSSPKTTWVAKVREHSLLSLKGNRSLPQEPLSGPDERRYLQHFLEG